MRLSLCIATSSSLPSEKAMSESSFSSVQMLLRLSHIEETIFFLRSLTPDRTFEEFKTLLQYPPHT